MEKNIENMDFSGNKKKKGGVFRDGNKEQKQKLALEVAKKANDGDVIGFGSGSTSFLTVL